MPRSHLTVLEASAAKYSSLPAFRTPIVDPQTNTITEWRAITYSQFHLDVERVARHWLRRLQAQGLPHRSVVGMWYVVIPLIYACCSHLHRLGGQTYLDVLHVYGLARAGYIPQMFSLRLPNPDVIYQLMDSVHAKALIYDLATSCSLEDSPVPTLAAVALDAIGDDNDVVLPSLDEELGGDDIFCIFHTSGSTSGLPKVIPCCYSWLDNIISKADVLCRRRDPNRQDVTTWV
jgi:acyl-CoA synthetase (AMP-forming)/AMP-acid ligase II